MYSILYYPSWLGSEGRRLFAAKLLPLIVWDSGCSSVLGHLCPWLPSEHSFAFPSQVEMFLLAYAVRHSIRVYRLSKYNTEEFITVYPTDPPKDWPMVTLIAEDDRHYNIPVRVCEETSVWGTHMWLPRDAHVQLLLWGPQICRSPRTIWENSRAPGANFGPLCSED